MLRMKMRAREKLYIYICPSSEERSEPKPTRRHAKQAKLSKSKNSHVTYMLREAQRTKPIKKEKERKRTRERDIA